MISSSDNPHIKHLRRLMTHGKARRQHGQTVLEGVHLLRAALDAGCSPIKVFVPHRALERDEVRVCLSRLDARAVVTVADKVALQSSNLVQGAEVLALINIPSAELPPCGQDCVVLAGVQDPGNVGTLLRSAAAAGVRHIVTDAQCADVFSPKVLRAGMGAHFVLAMAECADMVGFLRAFAGSVYVTTLTHHRVKSLYGLDLRAPAAWVFGNEGAGVSAKIAACADYGVKIPMAAGVESLNVAMAASVCLFEQVRQRIVGEPHGGLGVK